MLNREKIKQNDYISQKAWNCDMDAQNSFSQGCVAMINFLTYRNLYVSGGAEVIAVTGKEALHQKLPW